MPEPPPPSKPATGDGKSKTTLPFTALLMSALSCGIPFERAARMGLQELRMALTARSESLQTRSGSRDGGPRVREATQADIRAFVGA